MTAPARIVDTHQHVCWHGRDARGLVADLDAHDIAHAWLLTWLVGPREDQPEYHAMLNPALHGPGDIHPGITLADILAAVAAFPGRFVPGFCPHPEWQRAPQLLEAAHAMHGVRVCGEWKFRMLIDDPRCLEIFRVAGRLRMPVVLHLDVPYLAAADGSRTFQPKWFGGTIDNLERALWECPDTIFIGHAPGFWREISGDAATDPSIYPEGPIKPGGRLHRLFDTHANLRADLSAGSALTALRRDPGNAAEFITRFSDRLLFGRDYYGDDLHRFLQSLPLTPEVVEKIYWRNAEHLVPPPVATREQRE